jgi:putative membrane protein
MLWLKAFHIVFVVAWFTGIFGLPRLFVHHTGVTDPTTLQLLKKMERGMFGMMTIGAVMTLAFGIAMLVRAPGYLETGWVHAKLLLVALLIVYHIWCYRLLLAFREDRNVRSQFFYRVFNETPLLFLIAIVVLATVKPW